MKAIIASFLIIFILSCNAQNKTSTDEISSIIDNENTNNHVRLKGTKSFVILPKEFVLVKNLARYQKKEKLYFHVAEFPTLFSKVSSNLSKEAIESKGVKIGIYTKLKVNGADGIYFEGPSKYPGETKLCLYFGADSTTIMVTGVCKTADKSGKKEILTIMNSIFFDKDFELDPFELSNFTFDKTISGFKFNSSTSNMFVFSPNGHNDDPNDMSISSITIGSFPKMTEYGAEKLAKDLIWRYPKMKMIFLESTEPVRMELSGYTSFVLESKIEMNGKNGVLFQAVIMGENSGLLFLGSSFSEIEKYKDIFKRTSMSFKID